VFGGGRFLPTAIRRNEVEAMIPKALGQLLGLLTPVEARVGGVLLGLEAVLALRIIYGLAASASAFLSGTQ
jgi:hypothetical protein